MKRRTTKRNASASKVWTAIGALLLAAAFMAALNYGLAKQEKVDCYKWQNYEKNYALFEADADTVQHCAALGIEIKN